MTLGPLQADTLDLLTSLSERAIWVRSNCERNVVEVFDSVYQGTGAVHEPGTIWAGRQLTRAQRDHLALAALPLTVSVEVDGLGPVLFCHATARDDEEIVLKRGSLVPVTWSLLTIGTDRSSAGTRRLDGGCGESAGCHARPPR
jgi:hypothetical protein